MDKVRYINQVSQIDQNNIIIIDIIHDLLEGAKCPECDGSGATMATKKDIGLGSAIEQCRWCYQKRKILKIIKNGLARQQN